MASGIGEASDRVVGPNTSTSGEKERAMGADALSDVLRTVRLTGAIFFDCSARAPWVAEQPPREEILPRILRVPGI
jgi:hypothetical protein